MKLVKTQEQALSWIVRTGTVTTEAFRVWNGRTLQSATERLDRLEANGVIRWDRTTDTWTATDAGREYVRRLQVESVWEIDQGAAWA